MIKVLIIHQSAELYGSDRTLLTLLTHIDRSKFLPVVVLPFVGPLNPELEKIGIKVVVAPVAKLYRNMFTVGNMRKFFKEISESSKVIDKLHSEHKFDLVYSNTLAVLLGMIYARKRKIRHLWHVHEIIVHPKPIAFLFPWLLKGFADVIVCNSNATKDNLTQRIPSLAQKCTVIHNGVDADHAAIADPVSKAELGFSEHDIIVTLAGRISRLKGHKLLLDAYVSHLRKTNIKLLFVGTPVDGQEYHLDEVKKIIRDNKIEDSVKIIPFRKDLRGVWAITDIAVMPSTEAESFGLVALEAMLAGKPVIGSDHGGLTEIIVNGKTGILFPPNDVKSLAGAISSLASNPELMEEYGRNGKAAATDMFSVNRYVKNFEKVFAE